MIHNKSNNFIDRSINLYLKRHVIVKAWFAFWCLMWKLFCIKLWWFRAQDLFGSQIPVTTRGFELKISCRRSSYLTHTIAVSNLARSWSISIFCIKFSKFWNCILFVSWSIFFSTTLTLNNFKKKIVSS